MSEDTTPRIDRGSTDKGGSTGGRSTGATSASATSAAATDASSTTEPAAYRSHGTSGHAVYAELAASDDFRELRKRYRAFAVPWTLAFLAWYLLYVLMSNYATGFMDIKVVGNINVALVFGLLQFASTFGIAFLYSRHAADRFDPLADRLAARYDEAVRHEDVNQEGTHR